MLEGERLASDGRQCFTRLFYYIIGIGTSTLVNDSSARGIVYLRREIYAYIWYKMPYSVTLLH